MCLSNVVLSCIRVSVLELHKNGTLLGINVFLKKVGRKSTSLSIYHDYTKALEHYALGQIYIKRGFKSLAFIVEKLTSM